MDDVRAHQHAKERAPSLLDYVTAEDLDRFTAKLAHLLRATASDQAARQDDDPARHAVRRPALRRRAKR